MSVSLVGASEGELRISNLATIGLPFDSTGELSAPKDFCQVIVGLYLDYSGNVSEVTIIESNPPDICELEAVEFAKGVRFPDYGPGFKELTIQIAYESLKK